jgi:hypothetical protein
MSHYIWNRAERVDVKLMPNILITCFKSWQKDKLDEINDFTSQKRKDKIFHSIKVQRGNLNNAIGVFNSIKK